MEIPRNKNQIFFVFTLFLFLFFPLIVKAVPRGTILYKTSEDGKMYGYNNFDFSLITGRFYPGGVAIYIGIDKVTGEDMVVEADENGIRKIPAGYFVDLDKGEKFLGAKIPKDFDGMTKEMAINIANQYDENFDFTYRKQKGPQSGDWTSVGFVEKIYESAESPQLTYHPEPIWNYTYYSAFNITSDSYDNESEINDNHDCFSEQAEFSKIHKLGQGGFFERFFTNEAKSLIKAVESSFSEAVDEIIDLNVFGKKYDAERYFFFPYTQFRQAALEEVKIDIPVASYNKAQVVGGLSSATLFRLKTVAFSERIIKELTIERIKKLSQNLTGLAKIISAINSIKETVGMAEEGIKLLSKNEIDVDMSELIKRFFKGNKTISASLSSMKEMEEFVQSGLNESLEFFDLVNKGYFSKSEYQRNIDLELAGIGESDGQIPRDISQDLELFWAEEKSGSDAEPASLTDLLELEAKEWLKIIDIPIEEDKKEILIKEEREEDDEEDDDELEEEQEQEEPLLIHYFSGDVIINELAVYSEEIAGEWIELYNKTNQSINLDQWKIQDNVFTKNLKGLVLPPFGYLVLNQGQNYDFYMNDSGDVVRLKYEDMVIDQISYGDFDDGDVNDNASTPVKGQFLARKDSRDTDNDKNDWFITTTPTPGSQNEITPPVSLIEESSATDNETSSSNPSTSSSSGSSSSGGGSSYQEYALQDVIINEIMYNPGGSDAGHEWIEIYNPSSSAIDLTNWKLYENGTNHRLTLNKGSESLLANNYAIICDDVEQFLADYPDFNGVLFKSSFSLNNTSETIIIRDGRNNEIDEISYLKEWGGNDDGNSIEKKSDNTWEPSLYVGGTPGQENSGKKAIIDAEEEPADIILPNVDLSSYPDNPTTENQAIFVFSADENVDFFCKIDLNGWENCFSPKIYGNLALGKHLFYLKAVDSADNVSSIIDYQWIVESEQEEIQEQPEEGQQQEQYQSYSFLDVVINEIAWAGTKADHNDEWIELYNNLSNSVDLSGWHLQTADGIIDIILSGQISANSYWLLERTDDTVINNIEADQIYTGALRNNGEYLQLKDGLGNIIDGFDFSFGWPVGDNDTKASMERVNSLVSGEGSINWQTNNGQEIFGLDAKNNLIIGTPKHSNSREIESSEQEQEEPLEEEESEETEEQPDESEQESGQGADLPASTISSPVAGSIFNLDTWPGTIEGNISPNGNLKKLEIQIQKGLGTQYFDDGNTTSTMAWLDSQVWFEPILDSHTTGSTSVWHFDLPVSLLEDDYYFIRSRTTDLSGNIQNTSSTVDFIFDNTPPEKVTGLETKTEDDDLSFTLSWDKVDDNLSGLNYYQLWDKNNNWNNGHVTSTVGVTLGLRGEDKTDYLFEIRACDRAGNCGESSGFQEYKIATQPFIFFEDDFEDNDDFGWERGGETKVWRLIDGKYQVSLDGKNFYTQTLAGEENWIDYQFDFDIFSDKGTDRRILFGYQDEENYYYLNLIGYRSYDSETPAIRLKRIVNGLEETLDSVYYPIETSFNNGVKYHFTVRVEDDLLLVYLNGEKIINVDLLFNELTPQGRIGFAVWSGDEGNGEMRIDNVKVESLSESLSIPGIISLPFRENFDNGLSCNWQTGETDICLSGDCPIDAWQIKDGKYQISFLGKSLYSRTIAGSPDWQDYQFDVDLTFNSGVERSVLFHYQSQENYYQIIFKGYWSYDSQTPGIYLNKVILGQTTNLAVYSLPGEAYFNENRKYHLTLVTQDDNIRIYLDGEELIDYIDVDPIDSGRIGFAVWSGDEGSGGMMVDNVSIKSVTEPLSLPEISLPRLDEDLSDNQADNWQETGLDDAWRVENNSYILEMHNQSQLGRSVIGDYSWQDYQLDLDVTLIDGVDRYVFFRWADDGNYYCLDFMGQWSWSPKLSLSKISTHDGNAVLEEVSAFPDIFNNGEEYHLKIMVQGDHIRIYLNGDMEPIIDVEDSGTRLTRGNIGLGGWTGSYGHVIVYWNNIQVNPL